MCNELNMLTFTHYINWIKIKFVYRLLKSKNNVLNTLKDYSTNDSFIVKEVNEILLENYNIANLKNNAIDAINARIFYVQRHEPISLYFMERMM